MVFGVVAVLVLLWLFGVINQFGGGTVYLFLVFAALLMMRGRGPGSRPG